jgi:DNA-binding transcriptional ArsR family regulator
MRCVIYVRDVVNENRAMKSGIERAIEAAGSQAELARRLDISRQAVSLWVRRGRVPTWFATMVSKATGVPIDDLRQGDKPRDRILERLRAVPPSTGSELAADLGLPYTTVMSALSVLRNDGLVSRQEIPRESATSPRIIYTIVEPSTPSQEPVNGTSPVGRDRKIQRHA